jgi:hypothetical protein
MTQLVRTTASKLILRTAPIALPETDTGKRLLPEHVADSLAATADNLWQFLNAPAGHGWASSQYLVPATTPPLVIPGTTKPRLLYSLVGEDPDFTASIEKLRAKALIEGIEFDVADFGGVRSEADTVKILKYRDDDYAVYVRNLRRQNPNARPIPMTTWRPINPFGSSMHNYGDARDLKVTRYPSSFTKWQALVRLGALAPSCGLRWGGSFKRKDYPHFEKAITLAEAKRRYEART